MIQLDQSQIDAVEQAFANPFWMITGGAGTGKTTIIEQLTTRRMSAGQQVRLCAFAGKAAARLKEATKHETSTIHRLLRYNGLHFLEENLHGKHIIIDEASMDASDLLAEVLRREPASVTLVGDPAQLPPVGKGQPFHDLIALRPDLVSELSTCYRATEAIYAAASSIRGGNVPQAHIKSAAEKWDVMQTGDARMTERHILDWVRSGHIDFSQDVILAPQNGNRKGAPVHSTVASLNRQIVDIVNPRDGDIKIAPGDRVINTKNNSDKDVWNGTTGSVVSIDIDGSTWVRLDVPILDRARPEQRDTRGEPFYTDMVGFSREEAKHLQLAYALTVHKSQGSQYRRVIFICLQRDSFALLDRSLIYTAITRAKNHCVVAGQVKAFNDGIARVRPKRTVIQELAAREKETVA